MKKAIFRADRLSAAERIARAQRAPGYRRYVYRDGKIVETTPKKGSGPVMSLGPTMRLRGPEKKRKPIEWGPGTPPELMEMASGPGSVKR